MLIGKKPHKSIPPASEPLVGSNIIKQPGWVGLAYSLLKKLCVLGHPQLKRSAKALTGILGLSWVY